MLGSVLTTRTGHHTLARIGRLGTQDQVTAATASSGGRRTS
ncbi:hypothetical protein ACIRFH_32480 [Streptomyces sp. NPDC093586]